MRDAIQPSATLVGLEYARHTLRLDRSIPSSTGGNRQRQERLYLRVTLNDGTVGFGECAPHATIGPSLDDRFRAIAEWIRSAPAWDSAPVGLSEGLLDAGARARGVPAWQILGVPNPRASCRTLMTFGGSNPEALCREIERERPSAVKLKLLGLPAELDIVREITRSFDLPLALDVNSAWSRDQAHSILPVLERIRPDLLWIEQPCAADTMRHRLPTALPIFADEALECAGFNIEVYDGVVLKPASSGLLKCIRQAGVAREAGKRITLGCQLQSSLLTCASLAISGVVTESWADLDSALLVRDDPFTAPTIDAANSTIHLPSALGFGSLPRVTLDWRPIEQS